MFTAWKYIIIQEGGLEIPILFPEILPHKDMAKGKVVISAGFVSMESYEDAIGIKCYGESVTLGKESRPIVDGDIIEAMLNG
jgi:hypothetical protein